MKIKEIGFAVYPSKDIARSRAFYEGVLGLVAPEHTEETGNSTWVEYEIGPGAALSIGKMDGLEPSKDGPSVALEVEDFDVAISELRAASVVFLMEPFDTPVCRMASIADPDGNSILIHKRTV